MSTSPFDQGPGVYTRTPAGFTNAQWGAVDPLEVEYSGPVPRSRKRRGEPYGREVADWRNEAGNTESIVARTLSSDQMTLYNSRGMGDRMLVRTVKGSGAQHARFTQGNLGWNHVDIDVRMIDEQHRSSMIGYQREMAKVGGDDNNPHIFENFDSEGNRVKLVIQTGAEPDVQAMFRKMKAEGDDAFDDVVNDIQKDVVSEQAWNRPASA